MTKRWVQEHRNDHFYKKARKMNYRSRSAFKLLQIDSRFGILQRGDRVVDLGAAPGGWLQVAKEAVGPSGLVVGVDLDSIRSLEGVRRVRGDVRDRGTLERLLRTVDGEVDVVLSDMSPNISGNYHMDHARSVELVEVALSVARVVLRPGGSFVAKVFQGDMMGDLKEEVSSSFKRMKLHSPKASRPSSSEVYIVARKFVGPGQEDFVGANSQC